MVFEYLAQRRCGRAGCHGWIHSSKARRRSRNGVGWAEECVHRGGRAQADAGAVWIRYYRLGATYERPTIWELTDFVHSTALLAGHHPELVRSDNSENRLPSLPNRPGLLRTGRTLSIASPSRYQRSDLIDVRPCCRPAMPSWLQHIVPARRLAQISFEQIRHMRTHRLCVPAA